MREVELAVIGGGVAGRAAAREAANFGVETLLIDEQPAPLSWLHWQTPLWYGERHASVMPEAERLESVRRARECQVQLAGTPVDFREHTACWGAFDGRVVGMYDHFGGTNEFVRARHLILATGALDVGLAFRGWTIPGVMGGCAALQLLEAGGLSDRGRAVVLGSGSLGLRCADAMLSAGHEVVAVVEIEQTIQGELDMAKALFERGVEFMTGSTIREAIGEEQLERVMVAPCVAAPTGARVLQADMLVVATASAPSIELAYLLGCEFAFDRRRGGYIPISSDSHETSVRGVYVIGDAAGVDPSGDSAIAIAQGIRAGRFVAEALERASSTRTPTVASATTDAVARGSDDAYFSLWHRTCSSLGDDVLVCRCEGATRARLMAAVDLSGEAIGDEAKRLSRAGAGVCQGRCCRHTVTGEVAANAGIPFDAMPMASFRPPVRPVPMSVLGSGDFGELPFLEPFAAILQRYEAELAAGRLSQRAWQGILFKVREENSIAIRDALDERESARSAHALEVSLRTLAPH